MVFLCCLLGSPLGHLVPIYFLLVKQVLVRCCLLHTATVYRCQPLLSRQQPHPDVCHIHRLHLISEWSQSPADAPTCTATIDFRFRRVASMRCPAVRHKIFQVFLLPPRLWRSKQYSELLFVGNFLPLLFLSSVANVFLLFFNGRIYCG